MIKYLVKKMVVLSSPSKLSPKVTNYSRVLRRLFHEGLKGRTRKVLLVLMANFIGLSTAALAFGILITFIRFQTTGNPVRIAYFEFAIPANFQGLVLCGLSALIMGLSSSVSVYIAYWGILHITREFHDCSMRKALNAIDPNGRRRDLSAIRFLSPSHDFRHLPTVYVRYLSICFRLLLEIFMPFFISLFAVGVLFYLNPIITISIIPLVALYFIPFYILNKKAAGLQNRYLTGLAGSAPLLNEMGVVLSESDNSFLQDVLTKTFLSSKNVKESMAIFFGQMLVSRKATLLTQVFQVTAMVWLFVLLGWSVIHGGYSWASLLGYLIALRFAGGSIQRFAVLSVTISRFLPAVEIFYNCVQDENHAGQKPSPTPAPDILRKKGILLSCPECKIPLSQKQITLEKGIPVFVLVPEWKGKKGGKDIVSSLITALSDPTFRPVDVPVYVHGVPKPFSSLTIVENVMGEDSRPEKIERLKKILGQLGVLDNILTLPEGLQTVCSKTNMKSLSREARYAISGVYSILYPRDFIVIKFKEFLRLKPAFQERFIDELKGVFVIFADEDPITLSEQRDVPAVKAVTQVVVLLDSKVAACGSKEWLELQAHKIVRLFHENRESSGREDKVLEDLSDFKEEEII